jgi:hypothetical protein
MVRRLIDPWVGTCIECGGKDAGPASGTSGANRFRGCLIDGCLSFPFVWIGIVTTFILRPLIDPWIKANLVECRNCGRRYLK